MNHKRSYYNSVIACISTFLASTASSVFIIGMSSHFYAIRHSSWESAITIALTWLPGVLLLLIGGNWADIYSSRTTWSLAEIGTVIVRLTVIYLLGREKYTYVFVLIGVEGILGGMSRVLRTTCVAKFVSDEYRGRAATWIQTLLYVGSGIAGVVAGFILKTGGVVDTTWLAIGLSFLAAMTILFVQELKQPLIDIAAESRKTIYLWDAFEKSFSLMRARPILMFSLGVLILMGMFFQGSYTFFETIIPIQHFGLGQSAVGFAYGLSSVAVIAGAILYQATQGLLKPAEREFGVFQKQILTLALFGALVYAVLSLMTSITAAMILFTVFVAIYEFCFLMCYARFVQDCPPSDLGKASSFLHAIAPMGQGIVVLCLGWIFPKLQSFSLAVGCILFFYIPFVIILFARTKKHYCSFRMVKVKSLNILPLLTLLILSVVSFYPYKAQASANVGYGWTTSVMSQNTQENFLLGFQLGFQRTNPKESKVEIQVLSDTGASLLAANNLAKNFVSDPSIVLISGFPTSHEAMLAADVLNQSKDLLSLFIGASHEDLAKKGDRILTTGESMEASVKKSLEIIKKYLPNKRGLAVINPLAAYSVNQAEILQSLIAKNSEFSTIQIKQTDLDSERRIKLKDLDNLKDYDYLMITCYPEESDRFMEQLMRLPHELPIVVSSSWETLDVLRRYISGRKKPIYGSVVWQKGSKESQEFEQLMDNRYGREANGISSYGYDAGVIAGTLISRIKGAVTRETVLAAFKKNRCFPGTSTGTICFPERGGHALRNMKTVRFDLKKGFVLLE